MEFSANQIAQLINGTIDGNPDTTVNNVSKIEEGSPGTLSFLANPKYTPYIYSTNASIIIVGNEFKPEKEISATLIKVKDPYAAFAQLLEFYNKLKSDIKGISDNASVSGTSKLGKDLYIGDFVVVSENVEIGDNVQIYPNVYIGENCTIGDNTIIHPGVKIYRESKIGKDCRIHAGVIIGSDGFGFAPQSGTDFLKVAQIGNVIIEDNVEIGSNTTIDRATLGSTIIRKGVKLDNLIQIAHNVEIKENTVIAAQTGISGSTTIGKNCMIGGQVGIIGHLIIGDGVRIAAQSGIGSDIPDGGIMQGSPAFEIGKYRRSYVYFRRLSEMAAKIDELEKKAGK